MSQWGHRGYTRRGRGQREVRNGVNADSGGVHQRDAGEGHPEGAAAGAVDEEERMRER